MNNNVLEIKELCKTYYTNSGCVEALKNVNLEVKKGEILGVIGNSGCGKSTLLSNQKAQNNASSDYKILSLP